MDQLGPLNKKKLNFLHIPSKLKLILNRKQEFLKMFLYLPKT